MVGLENRRRLLVVIVAGSLVLGLAGMLAVQLVKSPQEAAAEQGPPKPSVLSAAVEMRVLTDTVVLRGQVTAGRTFDVAPTVSAEGKAVITGVRAKPGADVDPGQVVLEVSGRPVVVLPGETPAHRDLRPGAKGRDVAQLQSALTGLGFTIGSDRKGEFGAGTERAVRRFYAQIGYEVKTSGDEEAVRSAEQNVRMAERTLKQAERALSLAKAAAETSTPPSAGQPDPVEEAAIQVETAREDLQLARDSYNRVAIEFGPMMPLGEYVFVPAFPARVQQVAVKVGDEAAGTLATLSSGALVVTTRVQPAMRDLLALDMRAEVLSERTGFMVDGVISVIGLATDDKEAGFGHALTITTSKAIPADLAGQDVRITVTAASTANPVLVVPISAVSASADGKTIVVKLMADGSQTRVPVVAGVSGDGFLEVRPTDAEALIEGDRVVTGT